MGVMPEDIFCELNKLSFEGNKFVFINTTAIFALDEKLAERKTQENALAKCTKLNNKGKEYEDLGKINLAIKTYEKNIGEGCYPATNSFDRLMILYRKRHDYENELRVIKRACMVFKKHSSLFDKYMSRLEKVETLINKTK